MPIFPKILCANCGQKAGWLSREQLADSGYLCGNCRKLCSQNLSVYDLRSMNLEEVKQHMQYVKADYARFKNEFQKTKIFRDGNSSHGTNVLYVDENHRWWADASARPDIFTFEQVGDFYVELNTTDLSDEERANRNTNHGGFFYQGLPACPPDKKVSSMKFIVTILNHPYVRKTEISLAVSSYSDVSGIHESYECAYQMYQYFSSLQQTEKKNTSVNTVQTGFSPADEIRKYKELLDMGALTQEEFELKKKQLLGL